MFKLWVIFSSVALENTNKAVLWTTIFNQKRIIYHLSVKFNQVISAGRKCICFDSKKPQKGVILRVAERFGGANDGEILVYILLKNRKIIKSPIQLVQELP